MEEQKQHSKTSYGIGDGTEPTVADEDRSLSATETWHDTDTVGRLSASTCRRLSPVGTLTFTKRLDKVEIR